MKRIVCSFVLFAFVIFSGCAPQKGDFFDTFRSGYTAQIEGMLYDINFAAKIEMAATGEEGVPPATVTFYAPEEISGTVITRAADGTVTLSSGGISAGDMGGVGAALFSLFPVSGTISKTEVTEEGRTRLLCEGFEIEFLSDGTPYSVKTDDVSVTVVQWTSLK